MLRNLVAKLSGIPAPALVALIAVVVLGAAAVSASVLSEGGADDASSTTSPSASEVTQTSTAKDAGNKPPGRGVGGGTKDNAVVVINRFDSRRQFRSAVSSAFVQGDSADNDNMAYALSSCTDCRTVAVAVQFVILWNQPSVVTTDNWAIAINQGCLRCQTMAAAYQYVVTTDGVVHFTAQGEQKIAAIRQKIDDLAESDLPFPELEAQLDAQVQALWQVVDEELVKAGVRPTKKDPKKSSKIATESDTPDPTPPPISEESSDPQTTTPQPEPSASPSSGPSPSPSPSPSNESSPSPSG